jgi:linoleoyl-CoA desaturase
MNLSKANAISVKKIRYASSDTAEQIYLKLRQNAEHYFVENKLPKHATVFMAYKMGIFLLFIVAGYYGLTQSSEWTAVFSAYLLLTFASLLLSINLGHDAAHHALTGNPKIDDFIFQTIFMFQGLSGYLWQLRHNYSHHVLPNVQEHDTDMELTNLISLEADPSKAKWFHVYQHWYAPLLYSFVSFHLLFIQDFQFFLKKNHANLHVAEIPMREWVKMIFNKIFYFGLTFGLPAFVGNSDALTLVTAWVVAHLLISVFVAFTFFISHHVTELNYITPDHQIIEDSWIHHQITTTIDFSIENPFANFIFGGFNLHVAHHVFPEVSHEHYPALTQMIRKTLKENELEHWYQSFSFGRGCLSHLAHLRQVANELESMTSPKISTP